MERNSALQQFSINLHFVSSSEQPQDLSISRTQSQPELCPSLKSPSPQRPLSKMEQKQLQWERERAELQVTRLTFLDFFLMVAKTFLLKSETNRLPW